MHDAERLISDLFTRFLERVKGSFAFSAAAVDENDAMVDEAGVAGEESGMSEAGEGSVVFDLDGTLVDTAPDLLAVADEMLREMGAPPVPRAPGRLAAGQGARAMLTLGLEAGGKPLPPEEEWPALVEEFIRRYEARMTALSRPFAGVPELLSRLREKGMPLAVCTNKREALARKLLRELGLAHHFAAIVGGDTCVEKKPHPAPLRLAAERAGAVGAVVMLGDSHADMGAARAAGALPMLAAWGYVEEPLASYGAAHILRAPLDFMDWLASTG